MHWLFALVTHREAEGRRPLNLVILVSPPSLTLCLILSPMMSQNKFSRSKMKNEKQKTSVFGRSDQNDLKEWGRERGGMAGKGWSWLGHAGVVSTYPLHTHTHIHKKKEKEKEKKKCYQDESLDSPLPPLISFVIVAAALNSIEQQTRNGKIRFEPVAPFQVSCRHCFSCTGISRWNCSFASFFYHFSAVGVLWPSSFMTIEMDIQ